MPGLSTTAAFKFKLNNCPSKKFSKMWVTSDLRVQACGTEFKNSQQKTHLKPLTLDPSSISICLGWVLFQKTTSDTRQEINVRIKKKIQLIV